MSDVRKIKWPGLSGREYLYEIYPIGATFKEEPGNYIFARESSPGRWSPCYIGQTDNLMGRIENHEKAAPAIRKGATHIHAHLTPGGEVARCAEERDLITKWTPPCNN